MCYTISYPREAIRIMEAPLSQFAVTGQFADELFADILHELIDYAESGEPESGLYIGARWFLLESERAYPFACHGAGIDARKLREHLRERFEVKAPS
jgi:hypothetical protein